jgi:molecular chaperone Hsp33
LDVSELHKFLFDGLPVRGALVRLTDAWVEILHRRATNSTTGAYPEPVRSLLGEMAAAAVLMQSGIKFDGALVLQIFGDGPLKLAVAEVQSDMRLRATATLQGDVPAQATLSAMVNVNNEGKCAITLDPQNKRPGQQPYQGVVPLFGDQREKLERLSDVLAHYMLQSEQLDTTLVLAADDKVAAGLLIQRVPQTGGAAQHKTGDALAKAAEEDQIGRNEDYNRIAILAGTLKREELLSLNADTLLRRLFWEESVLRFEPQAGEAAPRFACNCSRERVGRMIHSLGTDEAQSIIAERGEIEVACEFCGKQYRFDPIDAAQIFTAASQTLNAGPTAH